MSCVERLNQLLKKHGGEFEVLSHRETVTAVEAAHRSHVARRQFAKVVLLRVGETDPLMAVIRADEFLDLDAVRRAIGKRAVAFASEEEILRLFPDCEVGAMPPFPHLWSMPGILDASFDEHEAVYFQAGNHHEVVRMSFEDFRRLAGPFTHEANLHAPAAADQR